MKLMRLLIINYMFWSTLLYAQISCNSWYGNQIIDEPVLCELIQSEAVQRLKEINQYGIDAFVRKPPYTYTRYDHSIGVLILLRSYHASLKEQIAGLLHDVSHTVFSHVGDHLFNEEKDRCTIHQAASAYQDDMFEWFIAHTDIPAILAKYGFTVADILPKSGYFYLLEQPLPDICADRLEYVLQGALLEGFITTDQIAHILQSLQYKNNRFVFTDQHAAILFARSALYLTEHIFGSTWNAVLYQKATVLLRTALKDGVITFDEVHFSTDNQIWNQLTACNNPEIQMKLRALYQLDAYEVCDSEPHDIILQAKFRGIDPWVQAEGGIKRLTELNEEFSEQYEQIKNMILKKRCLCYKE